MGTSLDGSGKIGDTDMIELIGKVMVVAIIILLCVVAFIFCLHLYANWFWYNREQTTTRRSRRRRRLDFAAGHQEIAIVSCSRFGPDPCVLRSIPVVIFDPKEFKDGLECAVCLCEVCEGEKARILPRCSHGFHVECIDMWFQSHSTCPVCRNSVSEQKPSNSEADSPLESIVQAPTEENPGVHTYSTEAPSFPTNVLIWGDDTQVNNAFGPCIEEDHVSSPISQPSSSSSSMASASIRPDGMLVIDIPRQINEEEEENSPLPTRFRPLSGNRK